ncbi:uncharacterized protein LOC114528865 [Dendronephthya gigantea]|uniref:uncharacterized protein LOC114528865 n=1 Tax=Dendronephthya gigantea TaxID=151771 RepID=UPI001068E38F|nr:uncharacterized protein LOC114528865 [Dendronephthya gigantea]
MMEIKEKYFDNGLRELLADEYTCVGTIMGLSVLQNGKLPQFLSEDTIDRIFDPECTSQSLINLQNGLEKLGLFQICKQIPTLREIFRPNPSSVLTMRKLNALLTPDFSPVGSNKRTYETAVYTVLCKYMRHVAAGRRGDITLGSILQFATASDEEPLLGFKLAPSIRFFEMTKSFLPTSNTCINALQLPYASHNTISLPDDDTLFSLYDEAFASAHFGNV